MGLKQGYGGLTAADAGQNSFQGYLGPVNKSNQQAQQMQPVGMGGMAQPTAAGGGYLDQAMGQEQDPFAVWGEMMRKKMEAKMGPYVPIPEYFGGAGASLNSGIEFSDYSPYVSAPSQGYR
jgi:hypothetical protein